MSQLDSLLSIVPSANSIQNQAVSEWIKACKKLMLSTSTLRSATDWNFVAQNDVDQTGDNILTGVGTFYAVLVSTNSADAEEDFFACTDAATNTFDGTAALDNTDFLVFNLDAAATDGTEEYHGVIWENGRALATGLTVAADGEDGTDPALDDIRCWTLYRG
mgnify:FL=1